MIDIVAQRVAKSSRGGLFTAPHLLLITFPDGRPDGELSVRIEHSALSAALEIPLPDQLLELRIRARYPASCSGGRRSAADLGRLRWWRPHPGSCGATGSGPDCDRLKIKRSSMDRSLRTSFSIRAAISLSTTPREYASICRTRSAMRHWPSRMETRRNTPSSMFRGQVRHSRSSTRMGEKRRSRLGRSCHWFRDRPMRSSSAAMMRTPALTYGEPSISKRSAEAGTRRIALATMLGQAPHDEICVWPRGDSRRAVTLVELAPATSPDKNSRRKGIGATVNCRLPCISRC